ncbi:MULTISPECIES: hypothetical protein [unclassified Sphingomonas]|uniref:hypothetical protein n=1 Tax=unclassified Sphingomonas TaxID=196159 RepID=UPI00092B46D9|nr:MULTISPECIES: hypothetical protein [unclassified Sphingomonas]MBN8847311.1 hypothetical protein [Sphingomonas sp.]OJV29229.1 MAG: hypothetical protein BGO24_03500 [Sphingomonas sp. 67-36]
MIMLDLRKPLLIMPLAGATLLGGCATYSRPASYSYFSVPCDTPGAVRAVPIVPADALPASPTEVPATAAAPAPVAPAPATANGADRAAGIQCLIAVADRGRAYGAGYYPGGYGYRNGYYGSPFRGSLGIGIGIGGHRSWGGHFRGGHGGGHHGGRH